MSEIELTFTSRVDLNELVGALLDAGTSNILDLILRLENEIQDESFSLKLVKTIIAGLMNEEDEYSTRLYGKLLQKDFNTKTNTLNDFFNLSVETIEERYKEADKRAKTYSTILKFLEELSIPRPINQRTLPPTTYKFLEVEK